MMTKAQKSKLQESKTVRSSAPRGWAIPAVLALGLTVLVTVVGNNWPVRAATDRFVAVGGTDTSNDCSNMGNPCSTIQHAIDQATSGDTINVLTGTYVENVTINKNVTIQGGGSSGTTVNGNSAGTVFTVIGGVTATLDRLTITNGQGTNSGGGILNSGTVSVTNSTISGNSAPGDQIKGGGIKNSGGTVAVINSTISGNTAIGSSIGEDAGGIHSNGGTFTVINSTISNNTAGAPGAGGIRVINGTITVKNSIVATNTGGDCNPADGSSIVALGVNFSTDASCPGFTQVPSAGPGGLNLGPLQNNGGPTATHALLAESVAIDAVTDCTDLSAPTPAPLTTDQRGVTRPQDGDSNATALCDAGAFEVQPCTITCPANQTANTGPGATDCCTTVDYPDPTGPDCGALACSPPSGSCYPVGTTTVTCGTVQDGPSCTFTVTVNDTTPPAITCPMNQTLSPDANCQAVATYSATASDNCSASPTVMCTPPSGSTFPTGTTTVTCTATDGASNTAMCTFTVTVNDTQPPSITCPANITKPNDPNQCGAMVTYPNPTVSDNCPNPTFTCSPASGSFFPAGTTTVTCTAKDAANNMASCTFTVTVQDTQPPSFTCPANKTAKTATINDPCVVVTFAPPTGDNCSGVTTVCNPASGSCFPVGTTTVTCSSTDVSANTATCSFTVNVFNVCLQDDSNPSIVFLGNTITGAYRFCCGGTVFTGVAQVTRRGNVVSFQHNPPDRRVQATDDEGVFRGSASLQSPPGTIKCTITDRDTRNNNCVCQ